MVRGEVCWMCAGILPAVFGLVGVIVGGLITGGSTYLLERRREGVELNTASRLIDAELLVAQTAAHSCIEKGKWWPQEIDITTDAWESYKAVIAPGLPYSKWRDLSVAARAVSDLASSRGSLTGDVSESVAESMRPILRDIRAGRRAIAPLFLRGDRLKVADDGSHGD